jgi:Family of unknown function (DUF5985)
LNGALYILTSLTALLCAALLLRGYFRVRRRLLLWSGLCFLFLTAANAFVFLDLVLYREIDFYTFRLGFTALGMILLLYGLIWESQ